MAFLSYLINGMGLGSVYAIIALGYTMVYGIAKMLNFAHGDVIMIGAYTAFYCLTMFKLSTFTSIIISVVVCTILGIIIEKFAYKPLRKASSLSVLITAIGISYFLQNLAQILFGTDPKVFPELMRNSTFSLFKGQLTLSYKTLLTIIACILIMIFLTIFVNNTKTGKAMRACSQDKEAAQLMGINVDNTISITFAIGSGLAAIAAVLLCITYSTFTPTLGSMPGIKAFTAAVFGGIGSIPGAFVGGLLLGIIETLTKAYLSTQLSDAIVFMVLIIVLLIKPSGLLGKRIHEKV